MDEIKDVDKPFRVVTIPDDNFHSGHLEKENAEICAELSNKEAEKLGIKTRYKVIEKI